MTAVIGHPNTAVIRRSRVGRPTAPTVDPPGSVGSSVPVVSSRPQRGLGFQWKPSVGFQWKSETGFPLKSGKLGDRTRLDTSRQPRPRDPGTGWRRGPVVWAGRAGLRCRRIRITAVFGTRITAVFGGPITAVLRGGLRAWGGARCWVGGWCRAGGGGSLRRLGFSLQVEGEVRSGSGDAGRDAGGVFGGLQVEVVVDGVACGVGGDAFSADACAAAVRDVDVR